MTFFSVDTDPDLEDLMMLLLVAGETTERKEIPKRKYFDKTEVNHIHVPDFVQKFGGSLDPKNHTETSDRSGSTHTSVPQNFITWTSFLAE